MTDPIRRADLSFDPVSLNLITDSLISAIAERLRNGETASVEKQVLFQLFIADVRSQQAVKPEAEEEEAPKE